MLLIRVPISFLTLDVKDAVITLAAFLFGSAVGPIISLIVAIIEMITVSGTGFWGFVMNFAGSAAFSFVAAAIFRRKRTYVGAIVGLYAATLVSTAVMLLMNLWITPLYMMVSTSEVIKLIMPLLLPFNLSKGLINAIVVLVLFQPVFLAAVRTRMVARSIFDWRAVRRRDVIFFAAALLFAAVIAVLAILRAEGVL